MQRIFLTVSLSLLLMIGLVFIPHPSEAIDKKDTDLSPSQVKDYSSHAKQLSSSCGLSQSEINRLFIHFGKLDLSAALPALKNVSAELGHIENHAINGQMTEKERQQWVAKINDGLELLQLKADFYMKTDDGTKPLSLNTLVSKQTLEDTQPIIINIYDTHNKKLADLLIKPQTLQQVSSVLKHTAL
ncbi:hypothetical protein GCM10011391_00990 [Pullulanibacillus camelliae]|uniref:Uncharacterized protein n=1 Tax=Pullulanibacillus camelliae TaxID=1707096 RepID=A0A8J2YES1_9BACL|nr:processed acidic surface protein [Pullulanibacillus camelliae]GGE26479.1 hypothetical protein GCM10011391_00990 [Pullulanibacillus camelliae]